MRMSAAGEPEGAQASESVPQPRDKHSVHCDKAKFELLCYFNLLNSRLSFTHLRFSHICIILKGHSSDLALST